MSFDIRIKKRDFTEPLSFPGVVFKLVGYSWAAIGGPATATIEASGNYDDLMEMLEWLRAPIEIFDENERAVWWGYLNDITIKAARVSLSASLISLFNAVAVGYGEALPGGVGASERATTDFATNADSVAEYGRKDLLGSLANSNLDQAQERRDVILALKGYPELITTITRTNAPLTAVLRCVGWWNTLRWRYYEQLAGLEEHSKGNDKNALGLGTVSSKVAFEAGQKWLSDVNGGLRHFDTGDKFRVTGSVSNNGTYTVEQGTNLPGQSIGPLVTISFEVIATTYKIKDSGLGLGTFEAHDVVEVSGSVSNDGFYRVISSAANGGELVVAQAVVNEAAGASITISKGNRIRLVEPVVDEMPGATVTLTIFGEQVAQSFQLEHNASWEVAAIYIGIRTEGAPSDNVRVALYDNGVGVPGIELDFGTRPGTDFSTTLDWYKFTLNNTATVNFATTYWIVVSRDGGLDPDDFYEVSVDDALGYPRGNLLIWDGVGWVARDPDADMTFRVEGSWETTRQIEEAVDATGEFFTGVNVVNASGVYSLPYRDGDSLLFDEVLALLGSGAPAGRRLLATVTQGRELNIYLEPLTSDTRWYVGRDGLLQGALEDSLEPQVPRVGEWVGVRNVLTLSLDISKLVYAEFLFAERWEYQVSSGTGLIFPRDARDPLAVFDVGEG